jgi:hypothetical protein
VGPGLRRGRRELKDLREEADERLLEKLARMIPGYGGYKDKELRREADKAQREYLSRRLRQQKEELQSQEGDMANRGFLDALGETDRTARRLERAMDRIRFASYGYAGFFDLVKVREDELDRLYEHDASLLEEVEQIASKISELEVSSASEENLRGSIKELDTLIAQLDRKLSEREDLLRGLK